jgi:molecular chaperone GrpE
MTEEEPKEDIQALNPMETELKECKDKYLRLLAESENVRKRMLKEKQDSIRFAVGNILADFLGPIDNFENALSATHNMSGEVKQWATGFQMILSQFKDILAQNGVTAFTSKGNLFDPHLHEAVETEETDEVPEGTILHEFVRGYRSGDQVLRAARVKVAKTPSKIQEQQQE